ncbi:hypothetical protein NDU88_005227 [Pleurodeles waltl]|uniref:Uncharacterized protein n=1 Tax=Pleurodeles waltl TaxID=8319 RepID=A0AAV7SL60_PLEWA|nr:hypothetical protein NDU88_005227 [Pleurodeles waltl]
MVVITTLADGDEAAVIPPTGRRKKVAITTVAETTNKHSHFNTPTATAGQTNSLAVTANRQAEDNVSPTVSQQANPPPFLGRIHCG